MLMERRQQRQIREIPENRANRMKYGDTGIVGD
jgi:hypothetical protein